MQYCYSCPGTTAAVAVVAVGFVDAASFAAEAVSDAGKATAVETLDFSRKKGS